MIDSRTGVERIGRPNCSCSAITCSRMWRVMSCPVLSSTTLIFSPFTIRARMSSRVMCRLWEASYRRRFAYFLIRRSWLMRKQFTSRFLHCTKNRRERRPRGSWATALRGRSGSGGLAGDLRGFLDPVGELSLGLGRKLDQLMRALARLVRQAVHDLGLSRGERAEVTGRGGSVQLLDRRLDQIAGDLVVVTRGLLDVADHELVEPGGRREGALCEVEIGVGILLLLGRHLESLLVAPCTAGVTSAGRRVLRHGRHLTVFFVQCKRFREAAAPRLTFL